MSEENPILAEAEAIARGAKREDMERIIEECEKSNDVTLRSLARAYRMLNFRFGS
jgi:hypothetical protein